MINSLRAKIVGINNASEIGCVFLLSSERGLL